MTLLETSNPSVAALARFRDEIDTALRQAVAFELPHCPESLAAAIEYSLLAPGKRLRPTLALLAAEACGANPTDAMPAACAVEMIHAYSLVHDDLPAMDDDDLRRGRPTCHKAFDEATAILVGDALQARAFELLATQIQPADRAAMCCAKLAQAAGAQALVGGQAADLSADMGEANLESLEAIHQRKTGAMIVVSLELGGIVAGASDAVMAALVSYGQNLGLVFQITDDLLDVSGNEADLGKRVGKDAGRGKVTFPGLLGIAESKQRAQAHADAACEALAPLGAAANELQSLAQFVVQRSS